MLSCVSYCVVSYGNLDLKWHSLLECPWYRVIILSQVALPAVDENDVILSWKPERVRMSSISPMQYGHIILI